MRLACGIALFALLGLFVTAEAGVIVDTTPANNQANMSASAGQTFTTGTLGFENKLDTITILTANGINGTDPVGPFTLKLFTDTDGNFATWDPGSEVAASTATASLSPAGNQAVVFDFSFETLLDNTVYAMSFNDGTNDHVGFRSALTNANGISDGGLFSGGSQPFSGAYDVSFKVETVPEPGTAGLAMFGSLAVAMAAIRRRRLLCHPV